MNTNTLSKDIPRDFLKLADEKVNTRLERCYQCGKCASSCPMIDFFDYMPYEIVRLVSLGREREVIESKTIWLCTSCYSCMSRCPNDINITKVIDFLKEINVKEKIESPVKDVKTFHELFVSEISRLGRINEFQLVLRLKFKTVNFFNDLWLGFRMFMKGKFIFSEEKVNGLDKLRRLMK